MAVDYTALKAKALELLTDNGIEIQIHRTGAPTGWTKEFDVAEGRVYWEAASNPGVKVYTEPSGATTVYSGYGVLTSWPKDMIDETLIQFDDIRVVVSIEVEIENGDKLVTPTGKEYTIVPPITKEAPSESTVIVQTVNARL